MGRGSPKFETDNVINMFGKKFVSDFCADYSAAK